MEFVISVPPMIWIQNQLVGAVEGNSLTLECNSEAYPKSINYWTREKGEIVPQGKNLFYSYFCMQKKVKMSSNEMSAFNALSLPCLLQMRNSKYGF